MNKRITFIVGFSCLILMLGFQNCSKVDFLGGESNKVSKSEGDYNKATSEFTVTQNDEDGGLAEIVGTCEDQNGSVMANGTVISEQAVNCTDDYFKLCTRLGHTGDNIITLIQNNPVVTTNITEIEVPIFTTQVTIEDLIFEFETVEVISSSQGEITVRCVPGSSISAQIYGSDVLTPTVCTVEGTLTFTVRLVPSLQNTGQRIVTVRQVMENGHVTEISIDVDNVITTHTCTIESGVPNAEICVDSAGEVSGTCKPGLPVTILVDGVAQDRVVCDSAGNYSIPNVLLGNDGQKHAVTIEQNNPFTDIKCTATTEVSSIAEM